MKTLHATQKVNVLLAVILFIGIAAPYPVQAQQLEWYSFEEALAIADSTGRPVMVDVWAPWCGWCLKMKRHVYPKLSTQLTKNFVLTRLNRDDNETTYQYKGERLTSLRLAQELKAESVPTVIFLHSTGDYLLHISGFVEANKLQMVLEYIGSGAYRQVSFATFQKKQ
ncbi:MAG: thioredoxin family protein [Balneolaceae bacterium]|nr:thioredoxin family protein [Balneolaceae bacterium]